MNNGEAITRIIENVQLGEYAKIADVAKAAGLTADEMRSAVTELIKTCEDFRAEPEPFGHRIDAEAREYEVMTGGEARHLICFYI